MNEEKRKDIFKYTTFKTYLTFVDIFKRIKLHMWYTKIT